MKKIPFKVVSIDLRHGEEDGFLYAKCEADIDLEPGFNSPIQIEVPVPFHATSSLQEILNEAIRKAELAIRELSALQ